VHELFIIETDHIDAWFKHEVWKKRICSFKMWQQMWVGKKKRMK